jgi:hypothetical protein
VGIRFNCPKCNHSIPLSRKNAGKRGRCPKCSAGISSPEIPDFSKPKAPDVPRAASSLPKTDSSAATGGVTPLHFLFPILFLFPLLPRVGKAISKCLKLDSIELDQEDDEWADQLDKGITYFIAGLGALIGLFIFFLAGAAIGVMIGGILGRGIGIAVSQSFLVIRRFLIQPRNWLPAILENGDFSRTVAVLITLSPLFTLFAAMVFNMK